MPTLEITTTIGCGLACTFCPQDKLSKAYGKYDRTMSLENFKTILDKVPKYVRIDFSGMSEPWLNERCTEMLEHTLTSGFNIAIFSTLVGMREPDGVAALLQKHRFQVECTVVHLPDADGNMRGFAPTEPYYKALRTFLKWGPVLAQDFRVMAMGRVHPSLGGDSEIDALLARWIPNDRAGALSGNRVEPMWHNWTPVSCSYTPFYDQNVLLPNGDVVICCMDYGLKHRIGNLLRDDYFALFASEEMGRLRAENTKCGGDGSICKRCDRAARYQVSPGFKQFWDRI